ncbi:sigma-70 family RNA polymerase sigma factor [Dysosmobacter sp. HCP28S3_G4]|uniref:sigma-70 family RNA polymerase sigma factor n=1 Tax=Dysosmobacter sp. HCP28S3_G4 TaxID=3438938 RepID=UPI003F09651D|nr:sigma-70 family RNA polymerase sigma factor [Dysosmobacter sp.]
MKNTASKKRVIDFNADLQVWMRENAEDNSEQLSRLKRNLRQARELELTPRQRQVLAMHFDQDLSVTQIARELHVNPSTITRTLQRAKGRLRRCLRYGF